MSTPPKPFALAAIVLCSAFAPLRPARADAQQPAPPGAARGEHAAAFALLEREDPLAALDAFRALAAGRPDDAEGMVGLGNAHLLLLRCGSARAYGRAALARAPQDQEAMALCIRASIRARAFDDALRESENLLARVAAPGAELLAARASALFRVQRIDDAAECYRDAFARDPDHAEASLRLGSGLLPPAPAPIGPEVRAAVAALRAGEVEVAIAALRSVLAATPGHPVVHRLLGEALFQRRWLESMAAEDPGYRALAAALPQPAVEPQVVDALVAARAELDPRRRLVVDRAAALFASRLPKLVALGARHDLLAEVERTTDDPARQPLRGKRTFDGRVWDDVRGVGGLRAATGIEALDDAAQFGFDTLAHELAHQVHYYALRQVERARIRELYLAARAEGRFLDYYAASNEAEYFGQGVEAFASYGKRPNCETTHGHTRFELLRVDPALHDFIARLVDADPLRDPATRGPLLEAATAVAMRCGRFDDAATAAGLLDPGPLRDRLLAAANAARERATSR